MTALWEIQSPKSTQPPHLHKFNAGSALVSLQGSTLNFLSTNIQDTMFIVQGARSPQEKDNVPLYHNTFTAWQHTGIALI